MRPSDVAATNLSGSCCEVGRRRAFASSAIGAGFLAAYLLAPERGLIAQARRRQKQRTEFALTMLTMHIAHHTATREVEQENKVVRLHEHFKWSPRFAAEIVSMAERMGLVQQTGGLLFLTENGLKRAQQEFTS